MGEFLHYGQGHFCAGCPVANVLHSGCVQLKVAKQAQDRAIEAKLTTKAPTPAEVLALAFLFISGQPMS